MIGANFTDPQFVDANGVGGLNAAFGAVSGSIALLAAAGFVKPGLYQPELMTVAFSGLTATVGLPAPFAVINASGVVAQAHGTATGSDTQSYAIGFSGLVPGSGSIVAYCVAQTAIVQQNPVPIPGPPPGHPSYNPNYQPTIGYAQAVDTLALSTTTTPPDGMSAFELFRTTLTAGEGSITSWSTEYQQRTTPYWAAAPTVVAGGNLTFAQSQGMLVPASGGITSTLPLAVSGTGLRYAFANTSTGTWTVVTQGSDLIYGGTPGSASGTASLVIPSQGACWIWGSGAEWLVVAAKPTAVTEYYGQDTGSANVYAVAFPIPYVTRVPGTVLYVKIANANTGASTLTPGTGLGATIVQADGTSLVAGALVAGMIAAFVDNGTYYQLVNPAGVGQQSQIFTNSGTFTVPTGVTALRVICTGAGGGGGGCQSTGAGTTQSGAGAGSGATAMGWITGLTPGAVITVTVGAGGNGGSGAAAGGAGSSSSFGSYLNAGGGGGGEKTSATSTPGGVQGSIVTGFGTSGGIGSDGQSSTFVFAGNGAGSWWGGGGRAGQAGGFGATAFGAGGGGAYDSGATGNSYNGGAGAPGIVVVEW